MTFFEDHPVALLFVIAAPIPLVLWWLESHFAKYLKDEAGEESAHGRDYYLGFTIGRRLAVSDVPDVVQYLREESMNIQLNRDLGGEKWFLAKGLPSTREESHELEAGLLAGALFRATKERFEVDEERCSDKGDGFCKFVAVRG